jgi:hypothetical protein
MDRERIRTMIKRVREAAAVAALNMAAWLQAGAAPAQQSDAAKVIQGIDAEVQARVNNVEGFTDIEHYAVYRGDDQTHPAAEMTTRDTYKKGTGKTYTILSQSGSGVVLKYGLHPLLENETDINQPGRVNESWFTSANYEMRLEAGGVQMMNGRKCYVVDITPKHSAPQMLDGRLWVDASDYSIAKVQGVASKSPSIFAGTTHMMREYKNIDGYPMATHARAESKSFLFGRTVVVIDYSDYHLQVRENK